MPKEMTAITQKITGKTKREVSAAEKERSALDEKLLRNAKKSLTELSEMTGLPAKDVSERLAWLLEDRGWMTERMEERYMLIELADLAADARRRLNYAEDKDYGGIAKVVLQGFQQMADRWDARRAMVDADIDKITAAHARLFGRSFDIALGHILDSLGVDEDDARELKLEGLRLAAEELSDRTIE